MKSLHLHIGLEQLLEDPLNGGQDQGREEEDVGEVEGEPAQSIVSTVCLDIPCMVTRVYTTVRTATTLTLLEKTIIRIYISDQRRMKITKVRTNISDQRAMKITIQRTNKRRMKMTIVGTLYDIRG